jgi:uncharacterized protein YkwD
MGNIRRAVTVLLAAATIVGGLGTQAGAVGSFAAKDSSPRLSSLKDEGWAMYRATNMSRQRHGLRKVWLRRELQDLATRHSRAVARRGQLFHTSDPSPYLKGVRWHLWGENVGYTTGNVVDLQRAFMRSTTHRHNVLQRGFRHVAVGAVRSHGKLWVTIFFYG